MREIKKKLSVITINLNNASGFSKTIMSVLNQDYADFEYIIVDGASTDGSVQIAEDLIKNYNIHKLDIKFISEKDTGIYNAMNKGVKIAVGEYCQFLNSGDYLASDNVYSQLFAHNYTEDFLYGNQIDVFKDGEVFNIGFGKSDLSFFNVFNGGLYHSSLFSKTILFDKYGLFDETYKIISDYIFFVKTMGYADTSVRYVNMLISYFDGHGISNHKEGEIALIHKKEIERAHHEFFSPRLLELCTKGQKKVNLYNYLSKYKFIWFLVRCLAWIARKLERNQIFLKNILFRVQRKIKNYRTKSITIFANHQVSEIFNPEIDCTSDWTSTSLYEKNIKWIMKHYKIISLEKAVSLLESSQKLNRNYAVFTFDDGYASIENAIRILEKYNLPATIFVNTAYLDDQKLSPVNIINYIQSKSDFELKAFPPEFLEAVYRIETSLNQIEYKKYLSVIDEYKYLVKPNTSVYITRAFLSNLNKDLFKIGLHGHEHLITTFLTDEEFVENINKNYEELKFYKNFVPYYAFSYGISDERCIQLVRNMSFVPFLCNRLKCFSSSKAYNRIALDGIDYSEFIY